jgi:hypothetical protein
MTIASGISKQTTFAKQTGLGVVKSGAGGQILRRENSVFALGKQTYESDEIVSHRQSTGSRHGLQSPTGKLAGLLSPGTYKLLMASQLRKDFVAGATTGAITTVTAAVTTGASGTFTRSAGSYLVDGFKVGDVVRWTGFAGGSATNNNSHNFMITALTATVMTGTMLDGQPVVADAAGDTVTGTVVGKKTLAPMTGHTNDYFTFEEWYPDISQSEQFVDCKQNMMTVDLPASGNAKVTFDLLALSRNLNAAQQYTSPAVETTTGICAAVTGLLLVNGSAVTNVTSVQMKLEGGAQASGPVVGSNFSPDITMGKIKVTGSFSAYFQDSVLNTMFQAETVLGLIFVTTVDNTPASDFVGFSLGRLKLGSDSPDDGEKGIIRQYSFVAEINSAGGAALANDQTIMSIQDSAA